MRRAGRAVARGGGFFFEPRHRPGRRFAGEPTSTFMSLTVPHSAIGLSDRLAQIIEGLRGVIAARGAKDRLAVPLLVLAWGRLRRLSARFASLAAKVRDGRLAAAPVRRRSADPAPALTLPPASAAG